MFYGELSNCQIHLFKKNVIVLFGTNKAWSDFLCTITKCLIEFVFVFKTAHPKLRYLFPESFLETSDA